MKTRFHIQRATIPVVVGDALMWIVALVGANLVRRAFEWNLVDKRGLTVIALTAIVIQLGYGIASGLYTGRWRFVSFEESGVYAAGSMLIVVVLWTVVSVTSGTHLVPRSTIPAAGAYQLVGAFAIRYLARLIDEQRRISRHDREHRALIYGAGPTGFQLVKALREDTTSAYEPVGFLDDDPAHARLQTLGLEVLGGSESIERAAARTRADTVIVAAPSLGRAEIQGVADAVMAAGLTVRIVPPVSAMLTETVSAGDVRELTLSDLLGRGEVHTDLEAISDYLASKRVLVTGAGGSIGSEVCRIVARYGPERLIMLDRDESALHALQLSIDGRALLDSPDLVLCDIRDEEAVQRVMAVYRPDVVFHAAAHKHLTLLERHPDEAFKTNVVGTAVLLDAAVKFGVSRFVNISTDKAAEPTSILGVSKRVAEMLTAGVAKRTGLPYISVRFGNVLGSRGSVIPTFRSQIDNGGPITVTHADVTRYFMTVEEAVQLVVQAGAIGAAGQVLVLDMGAPVKILDVAHKLLQMEAPDAGITIEFTGLRPGEKLHEVLSGAGEHELGRPHALITAYAVDGIDTPDVLGFDRSDPDALRDVMWKIAASSTHPADLLP